MDLKKCIDKLKIYTDQNLTTKELNELGITKHFINKLLEKGKLERVKRGTYCVKSLTKAKNKQSNFAIHNFSASAILENYEQAYNHLMRSFKTKTDNRSDNLFRIGFILLHEILENREPFPFDELQELTLENKPNSQYWNNFCTCVVNCDYLAAKENIENSAKQQLEKQNFIGDVTKAMVELVNKVLSLQEDKAIIAENVERISTLIEDNKYEEALEGTDKILQSIKDDKLREKYQSLTELIKNIISFRNDEKLILNNDKKANYGNQQPKILMAFYLRDNDYLKALNHIDDVYREYPDTYYKLIRKLLYEFKELNNSHSQNVHKVSLSDANYHFKKFLKVFSIDNIDEAMEELSLSISYMDHNNDNYLHNNELLAMFKKLKNMRDNNEILEEMDIDYNLKKDPITNFNYAIEKGDYKKAKAFSHIARINGSVIFDIKRQLLTEMIKLDNVNKEKQASIQPIESSKEEVVVKDNAPTTENASSSVLVEAKELITETSIPPVDELIDDELREEASKLELNYETIYDLVYNRNYELAYALAMRDKERYEFDRLCSICIRLIRQLKKLEKGHARMPHHYEPTGDKLKDFYQALKNYDYEFAYGLADVIIEQLAKNSNDPSEFEIYKLLLEDLKELQEKVMNDEKEFDVLTDKVTSMSIKQEMTREDIEELILILNRKIELSSELSLPQDLDYSLLNIAQTTILSLDGKLNSNDFAKVECDSLSDSEIFINAINQGDYITSQEIINKIDWKQFKRKFPFDFLRLANKMLNMMISNLYIVRDQTVAKEKIAEEKITQETSVLIDELAQALLVDEDKAINDKIDFLREIKPIVKNRQYEEVLKKVLETTVSFNHEFDPYILGNLAFVKASLDHEANELYDKYLESLETCCTEETQRYLSEYKEFLKQNYMEDTKNPVKKSLTPEN